MTTPTLTTAGTAYREQQPSLATVEVTVRSDSDEPAVARSTARDRAETIRNSLTAVSTDQVDTVDIRVQEADEVFGPDTDSDYRAEERLMIECLPSTAEDVVIDVTEIGGTVQNVEFGLHMDAQRQLEDETLEAALDRARKKAERLATAEGMAVAGIQSISTTQPAADMDGIVDEALDQSANMDISPPPVKVSKRVEVVYELTKE